jgi:hypothetical protein
MTPHAHAQTLAVKKSRIQAEFKKALARESGPQVGLFDEKNEGRKSPDTVPLRPNQLLKTMISHFFVTMSF